MERNWKVFYGVAKPSRLIFSQISEPEEFHVKLHGEFACQLYGKHVANNNKVHFTTFFFKTGSSQLMPPRLASLEQQVQRENYMAAIWKCSNADIIVATSPVAWGWLEKEVIVH